jgi:hypothetical protein
LFCTLPSCIRNYKNRNKEDETQSMAATKQIEVNGIKNNNSDTVNADNTARNAMTGSENFMHYPRSGRGYMELPSVVKIFTQCPTSGISTAKRPKSGHIQMKNRNEKVVPIQAMCDQEDSIPHFIQPCEDDPDHIDNSEYVCPS